MCLLSNVKIAQDVLSKYYVLLLQVKMREKMRGVEANGVERPTSIADRMSLLEGAQKDWTKRISQKDVKQFTVEGKLSMAGLCMFV